MPPANIAAGHFLCPTANAGKDDLMNTGFIPTQISWPVSVTVMSVSGYLVRFSLQRQSLAIITLIGRVGLLTAAVALVRSAEGCVHSAAEL